MKENNVHPEIACVINRLFGSHVPAQDPADAFSAEDINDHCQVDVFMH
jgi:hypothetical protein